MKRLTIISMFAMITLFLAACGGSSNETNAEGETYELDMSVTVGESSTWFKAAEKLAEDVNEKSNGRISINVYPNEQLSGGDSATAVSQVANGTQDMSYNSTIIYSVMDERFGVLSAPFLFPDLDTAFSLLEGEGGEMINNILRENGVEPLGFGLNGFRQVTTSGEPIKTPADLEGLKIRVPGIEMYTDLWREFGSNPATMTFSEVFSSLQQGTIDGQENPVEVIHSSQLNEVQNSMTIWDYSFDPLVLGINKELFDSMSEEDQQIMKEAAAAANEYQIEETRKREEKQIEELKESGMEVYELSQEEKETFKETMQPIYDQYESVWGEELLNAFQE
ncbi:tripartite ATP-independent transporter solute receptor, DctP family [Lentibacillus halodurans]|uniref:Tripartite ATP-independent transporter solute receptor, DctP family n=1 Tax=Lentibacillus halodurans TaxID=237679 RepID=A0A1I0VIQ8_9BACI|nr:DctP family TRAP transporter solute-binding subunit [Lentibacillus halodurans]SFA76211.1 tripartite ATP-independent transporter solute receptor, DctP family [Lentibacillus halodurans]